MWNHKKKKKNYTKILRPYKSCTNIHHNNYISLTPTKRTTTNYAYHKIHNQAKPIIKKVKSQFGSIKFWYHFIYVGRICDTKLDAGVVTGKDST